MSLPRRRSPRLSEFDYREPGFYFVTICTSGRKCLLGHVDMNDVVPTLLGELVHREWLRTLEHRQYLENDAFVVMPNHVHLLFGLWTTDTLPPELELRRSAIFRELEYAVPSRRPPDSVPAIINGYKAAVTRVARQAGLWDRNPLWQPRYYDRIVRNERERKRIRNYIRDNPRRWGEDRCGPVRPL